MKAKLLLIVASLVAVFGFATFGIAGNAYAVSEKCGEIKEFMGLTPWYAGGPTGCLLDDENWTEANLPVTVWTIVLNLVGDVVGILGFLTIGLVIWGGYQYMLSQGDAGKAAKGKMTIVHAMIGLIICILASTITRAIADILKETSGTNIFIGVFNHAFTWAAIVAVIMIILGGIFYVTSNGDAGKVAKAKSTIIYAAIGLAISVAAIAIVNTVLGALG